MGNRQEDIISAASRASRNFFHEISEGHISGHSGIFLFGQNDTLTSNVIETIWPGSGSWVPPTGASKVNILSTSVYDNPSGIGARLVFITGLDEGYQIKRESIATNGTSNSLSSNSYIAINELIVLSAGLSGCNTGNITANQQGSSLLLNMIKQGHSVSHSLLYTVPSGSEAHIHKSIASSSKISGGTSPKVKITTMIYNPLLNIYKLADEETFDTDVVQLSEIQQIIPYIIGEMNTIFVNVVTDTTNTVANGRLYMIQDDISNID